MAPEAMSDRKSAAATSLADSSDASVCSVLHTEHQPRQTVDGGINSQGISVGTCEVLSQNNALSHGGRVVFIRL
jgi:hypothetical protein